MTCICITSAASLGCCKEAWTKKHRSHCSFGNGKLCRAVSSAYCSFGGMFRSNFRCFQGSTAPRLHSWESLSKVGHACMHESGLVSLQGTAVVWQRPFVFYFYFFAWAQVLTQSIACLLPAMVACMRNLPTWWEGGVGDSGTSWSVTWWKTWLTHQRSVFFWIMILTRFHTLCLHIYLFIYLFILFLSFFLSYSLFICLLKLK